MQNGIEKKKVEEESRRNLLVLYQILFTKLSQEGDGIWSRFHFLVAYNLSLFVAAGYVYSKRSDISMWWEVCIAITLGGIAASIWSSYVIRKLWGAHTHWKKQLKKIEAGFPRKVGWARALLDFDDALPKDPSIPGKLKTTQPFF